MIFKNSKVYDVLKWIVITFLPALTAFVMVLLPAVGCPEDVTRVVGIVLPAFTAFLGTLIGVSGVQYKNRLEG